MYQYWLTDCNRNKRESSSGRRGIWSVLPAQCIYEPKTAFKNTLNFKIIKLGIPREKKSYLHSNFVKFLFLLNHKFHNKTNLRWHKIFMSSTLAEEERMLHQDFQWPWLKPIQRANCVTYISCDIKEHRATP